MEENAAVVPTEGTTVEVLDLKAAMNRFRSDDREILILNTRDGRTYDELAERLGILRGTVRAGRSTRVSD